MPTQTDSTTANFDAGTKSESSSNREMITITNAVSGAAGIVANELRLENNYSDKFDIADADATTWKWTATTPAGNTQDINTTTANKLYQNTNTGSSTTKVTQSMLTQGGMGNGTMELATVATDATDIG